MKKVVHKLKIISGWYFSLCDKKTGIKENLYSTMWKSVTCIRCLKVRGK